MIVDFDMKRAASRDADKMKRWLGEISDEEESSDSECESDDLHRPIELNEGHGSEVRGSSRSDVWSDEDNAITSNELLPDCYVIFSRGQ